LVVADAAQAVPRYFSNNGVLKASEGKFGEAGVKEVLGWGAIDQKCNTGGAGCGTEDVTCRDVIAGDVWNPIGGGAGKGKTQAWAVFDCETNICIAGNVVNVVPENLPWISELTEGGLAKTLLFRSRNEKIKEDVTCNGESARHFQGSIQPGAPAGEDKGTSAAHPGFLEYDQPGSGGLEEVELTGTMGSNGVVHELGYNEQELIQVK
jgi:hypothetical protein